MVVIYNIIPFSLFDGLCAKTLRLCKNNYGCLLKIVVTGLILDFPNKFCKAAVPGSWGKIYRLRLAPLAAYSKRAAEPQRCSTLTLHTLKSRCISGIIKMKRAKAGWQSNQDKGPCRMERPAATCIKIGNFMFLLRLEANNLLWAWRFKKLYLFPRVYRF